MSRLPDADAALLDPVAQGTQAEDTGSGTAADGGIVQLVSSATRAAGCRAGVYYGHGDDGWAALASFGVGCAAADPWHPLVQLARERGRALTFVLPDLAGQGGTLAGAGPPFGASFAPIRFVAAVPVRAQGGERPGLLLVADSTPRAELDPAMDFVLQTHAGQIAAIRQREVWLRGDSGLGALVGPRRHSLTEAANERLRLLESVVVNANDAVLITLSEPIDQPGPIVVYCNAAFTRTTGFTSADIIGRTPRLLQSPDTDRAALDRIQSALSRWEPVEVELLNRKKDGTAFWVEVSIVPVADERGWFTHWVSVQRDVTERRAAVETAVRARVAEAEKVTLEAEIAERRAVEARLLFTAFHDGLTTLHNRAYFMDRLSLAVDRAARVEAASCAVLFIDLDGFKLVNDSLGHRAGDQLLIEVSQRLRHCIRPCDTLARLGGDEFALIIESSEEPLPAVAIAERVIETIRAPIWLGKQEVFCSCSIGIVVTTDGRRSPEDMLRDADLAMYTSKRIEPGRYTVFGVMMHDAAVHALELQTDLRNAITREEFFLEFQPVCDATSRQVVGVEALVRWRHPQRGIVPPLDFIATAEAAGFIRDIGRWVLQEACHTMERWRRRFPGLDLCISVNVSGKELLDPFFVEQTLTALQDCGLPSGALVLEVTESVFLTRPEQAGEVLAALRAAGVRVGLDDFGTGFSSLGFIDRYKLDSIKIDRSFVGRMLTEPRTMAIVRSIIRLGHDLGLAIVAEGIENEAQLQALRANGCPLVQGYLLSRPKDAAAMEALFTQATS